MSDTVETSGTNRRELLTRAGVLGALALGSGVLGFGKKNQADAAVPVAYGLKHHAFLVNDIDILNFALNLEYLEAEFYQRAVFGAGLSATDTGGSTGNVTGGTQVPFSSPSIQQIASEIAGDELNHVRFLRAALGKHAVVEPTINFTDTFTALAIGAGVITAGQTFNPFDSDLDFLIGAYIFEDVGVTAYHGAASYIRNTGYLGAAAGILAVEAYHAGTIRTLLLQEGPTAILIANKISAFRDAASRAADPLNDPTDQGINDTQGKANVTPVDSNSIAYSRTFAQVLNVVYGSAASVTNTIAPVKGGFFPLGLNGRIK